METTDALDALPTDFESLQQLCLEQARLLQQHELSIQKKQNRIDILEELVSYLKRKHYGSSSERHVAQAELFNEAESLESEITDDSQQATEASDDSTTAISDSKTDANADNKKRKPGRRKLPENLPRVKVYHDLGEHDKHCSCGCMLEAFDEVTSEQLSVKPAEIFVIQHCRKKYRCTVCESTVKTASLPPQPIPKSNAGPALIAFIMISKFLDGLPFYRQEKIWERVDTKLPRATQANWSIQSSQLLTPLLNLLYEKQREGPVMYIDETPVQVLKELDKSPQGKKHFWVTVGGTEGNLVYRFHYNPSRGGEVARELLMDFQGTVISDDWSVYPSVCKSLGLRHIACNDHARRKYKEALDDMLRAKGKKDKFIKPANASLAEQALEYYKQLYAIEARIKPCTPDEKYHARQNESKPIWQTFKQWIDTNRRRVTPESGLGKALRYSYKLFDKLCAYCEDGHLPISNEKAENAIRPFAIARKNFLFYDTPRGATASEGHYSLIMTAKMNGIDPFYYLAYVFKKLPLAKTLADVEALLPWNLNNELLKADFEIINGVVA